MTTFTQSNVPPLLSLPFSFQSGWFYLSAHYLLGHFDLYICLNRTLSRSEYLNEMDLLLRIKWKGCLTIHSNFSCKYERAIFLSTYFAIWESTSSVSAFVEELVLI